MKMKEQGNTKFRFGDHVKVKIDSYYHHGIYVSDSEVIHFCENSKFSILSTNLKVQATDLQTFAQKRKVEVVDHKERNSRRKTVEFARSKIGETDYDLMYNNCEHFVSLCVTGKRESEFINIIKNKGVRLKRADGLNGFLYKFSTLLNKLSF